MEIAKFLEKQEINFKNIKFYITAFTHTSYVHESKIHGVESYERLEFLGDSILGHIISEYIYEEYPEFSQGSLTLLRSALVKKSALSKVGKELHLEKYINIGQGEDKSNLSPSVYEDVFESLTAAIYLDLGYKSARKFVYRIVLHNLEHIYIDDLKDFKTKLQELLQAESGKSAVYKTINQKRINNIMHFKVEVSFNGQVLGAGSGKSKKEAEQAAAHEVYTKMAGK